MNDNIQINFSLKGLTSILIGAYFFIAGFLIETLLKGFLVKETPFNLSSQTTEILIITIILLVFIFSSLALFFNGKRNAKNLQLLLWNDKSKVTLKKYIIALVIIFASLLILMNLGYIAYLTPTFLILYGISLFSVNNKDRKNLLILAGLSVLLAVICFLIPTYWSASLSILGIAHVAYGVSVKE